MADRIDLFSVDDDNEIYANFPVPVPELAFIAHMEVDVKRRTVYVSGEIDESFGPWFATAINYLNTISCAKIDVFINTPGGEEVSMFAFHDIVRGSSSPIRTIGVGQVCSAGVLMLACGHERLVTESCVLMAHRGKMGMDGDLETMEARMEYVKWSEQHWARLMDRYTPDEVDDRRRDVSFWFQLGKKRAEWWLFGGAAIVHEGIADSVI